MWPIIYGVFSGFFDNFGFCGQIYDGKSTKNLKKVFYIIRVICEKKTTLAWKGYPFYEKRFKKTIIYQGKKLKIYQKHPRISDKKIEKCSILYLQLRWKSTFRELFQLFWAIINGVFSGFFDKFGFFGQIYTRESAKRVKKVIHIIVPICEKNPLGPEKGRNFHEKGFKTIDYQGKS